MPNTTDGEGGFGTTMTNRIRPVPVPPDLVAELRAYGADQPSGQIFLTRTPMACLTYALTKLSAQAPWVA